MADPQRLSADDACAIAVSRITAARDSGAWLLSLGDLDLERLPNELATLTQLRFLALGGESYSEVNGRVERSFNSGKPTFSDLAALASLAALEALDLFRSYGVTDLTPLTNLRKLRSLNLNACKGLTNLTPLAHLKALQRVTLKPVSRDGSDTVGWSQRLATAQPHVLLRREGPDVAYQPWCSTVP